MKLNISNEEEWAIIKECFENLPEFYMRAEWECIEWNYDALEFVFQHFETGEERKITYSDIQKAFREWITDIILNEGALDLNNFDSDNMADLIDNYLFKVSP